MEAQLAAGGRAPPACQRRGGGLPSPGESGDAETGGGDGRGTGGDRAVQSGDPDRANGLLLRQIPLTPAGELVAGDLAAQTRRVMDNLAAVLQAAGGSLADVVKTTIYCTDLGDFATINDVYGSYFASPAPARATVQVAALPKGARVEIEAVAVLDA